MKNKILLLIIAIFSFALYVGRVEADDSGCYTCLSLGEVSWGEKPSRQCPNGEWELNSDIKKEKKCVFDCSDKETCEKVNWLARCEYKQMAVYTYILIIMYLKCLLFPKILINFLQLVL